MLVFDLEQIKDTMQDLRAAVCVPCFFRDEFLGILVLGDKQSGDFFSQDDLSLFSALSNEAAIALKNSQLYFEIDKKARETEALYEREHKLFMHASVAFAAAVDARDPYTHGHSQRVTNISLAILDYAEVIEEVGKNVFFRQRLQITGVLHDIGKIGVPDDILHKPSKLTSSERRQIEKHPVVGADIISHIKGLRDLIGGIKYHHERYDGKGYPEGLKSEDIPLMARIIAVADTYDAMTSDRPYRKGLPALMAKEEIQRNASTQFDPYLVAAFLKAFEQGKVK
jgi:HD-GYP domain-containing protein (c-di-GMP phosphodiesterase class II)